SLADVLGARHRIEPGGAAARRGTAPQRPGSRRVEEPVHEVGVEGLAGGAAEHAGGLGEAADHRRGRELTPNGRATNLSAARRGRPAFFGPRRPRLRAIILDLVGLTNPNGSVSDLHIYSTA